MVEWSELGVFCSVIGGIIISLCITVQKSRCDQVSLCCGLVNLHRKVPENVEEEKEVNDNKSIP